MVTQPILYRSFATWIVFLFKSLKYYSKIALKALPALSIQPLQLQKNVFPVRERPHVNSANEKAKKSIK